MPAHVDITGQLFGRLTAVCMTATGSRKPRRSQRWLFRCDCGGEIEVDKHHVIRGATRSCSCLAVETRSENGKKKTDHGHCTDGKTSPEYKTWQGVRDRCGNPNATFYKHYGGRGICVCERWANSFENFLADMGPRPSAKHSIDRINNDGHYEPGNCRWALPVVQHNNTRSNRRYTLAGETHTEAEWCRELGVTRDVLSNHLNWHPEFLSRWVRIRRERASRQGPAHTSELRGELQ
jgi:hypothetical protein